MRLKLSDTKVGTPSVPTEWVSGKGQMPIPNYKQHFLNTAIKTLVANMVVSAANRHRRHNGSYDDETTPASIMDGQPLTGYVCDNLPETTTHFHVNYIRYLQKCWSDHLGVVVTPDILWYTILSEIALTVKAAPNKYRSLFTTSDKVEDILVLSYDPVVMPLDTLVSALTKRVPTDTSKFFPEFSTRTTRSLHACQAAFCDICSPYYNYSMYLCEIPVVDVRGDIDDYKRVLSSFSDLTQVLGQSNWAQAVSEVLNTLVENFDNPDFWKNIFSLKRCGSGGQVEVGGWFQKLFQSRPSPAYAENFSTHSSVVKYKNIDTNKNYEMAVGLFGSSLESDFMVPEFSFVVREVA